MPLTIQRRLKTSFDSQHDKLFQKLVKNSWEYLFQQFFITMRRNDSENVSPIEVWNHRVVLLTQGLPITSIMFRIVRYCCSLFKSSYLKNKRQFLGFLFHLWNLHQILNIFEKKKILIAIVFPKLATV